MRGGRADDIFFCNLSVSVSPASLVPVLFRQKQISKSGAARSEERRVGKEC